MTIVIIILTISIVLFTLAVILMSCYPQFYNSKVIWGLVGVISIDFAFIVGTAIYWMIKCLQ